MCDPSNSLPYEFVEVLGEEVDLSGSEAIFVEKLVEVEDQMELESHDEQECHDLDIENLPVFLEGPKGALYSTGTPDDLKNVVSPNSSQQPRFCFEVQMNTTKKYCPAGKSRGIARVEALNKGGQEQITGGGTQNSRCGREKRLVERYVSDDELPTQLRETIGQLLGDHDKKRRRRVATAQVEEVEDNRNGEEQAFLNTEDYFVWLPMHEFKCIKENFIPQSPGPTRRFNTAYDAFRAYWDEDILSHIVHKTNQHAESMQNARFRRDWYDTNQNEIMVLFAFWIMLGIIKMPTIKSCFSKLPILRTEIFRHLLTETRYWDINAAFHLTNNSSDPNDPTNVLYPIGPVVDHLNNKYKEQYKLQQDICIDDSQVLWNGPGRSKQYVEIKDAKFFIKTYQLSESASGYLWSFFVSVDRGTSRSHGSARTSTVLKLIQPLLNLGHVLFLNNCCSPSLARFLKWNHTDCVGTLLPDAKNVSPVIQKCPLEEGEFIARQSGDMMVVALQDRKRVTYLSTFHDVSQVETEATNNRSYQHKLKLLADYNKGISGGDRLDQIFEPYLIERNTHIKWTTKLFKYLLNMSVQNARILVEKSTDTKIDTLVFRLSLVQDIINKHLTNITSPPVSNSHQRLPAFPISRLTERHFIRRIPITEEMREFGQDRTNLGRRQCVWCSRVGRRKSKTRYECPQCEMPLCLENCFEAFHTTP